MAALTQFEQIMNGQGLVVNAFRDAAGRGDYFSGSSGTSEGQFLFILGMLDAYRVTGNTKALMQAEKALSHLLPVLYRNMPIPEKVTETDIFAPHWLYSVKYPFNSGVIHYDGLVNFQNGVGYLPLNNVRKVFNARSLDAKYLWNNPYSSLTSGALFPVAATDYVEGTGQKVQLTTGYTGQLLVTYSTGDGPEIGVNEPYEAWPDWRKLDTSEIDAACDVFIWAYRAFILAWEMTGNSTWKDAARATVEQAAIAMDINDGRDWLKTTWSDSPFSDGARFSFVDRTPQAAFSVGQYGIVQIGVPTYLSGSGEVQYGKASVKDTYGADDRTTVEVGSSRPVLVTLYIDPTETYSEANRYALQIALSGTGAPETFVYSRTDFKNPAGQPIPVNSPVYTVGISTNAKETFTLFVKRIRQTPPRDIKYYPGAIPFTANFLGNPPMLIDWRGPVYSGYQAPPMWQITGNDAAALVCTQMLHDAQDAWQSFTGKPRGPFAPVFYFARSDAVQYGPDNQFGWDGPDPNTIWGGYQYRPLAECAETVWLGQQGTPLVNLATTVAEDFLTYLNNVAYWPVTPVQGPPTDFPLSGTEINYNEPHCAALIWRAVLKLDWKRRIINGEYSGMTAKHRAIQNRCIALYDMMYHEDGVMAGTFSQSPELHEWYGFWHGEILSTLCTALEWASLPQVNDTVLAAKCRKWISGLVRWSVSNSGRVESDWGYNLYPFEPDWYEGMSETWTFQTNIITSFDGSEQRLGQRQNARRAMKINLSLMNQRQSADYQAIMQSRQNKPVLLPQWHIGTTLAKDAAIGADTIELTTTPDRTMTEGEMIVLSDRGVTHTTWVRWVDGNKLTMNDPLTSAFRANTKVASAFNSVIDGGITSNKLAAAIGQAQLTFQMLPQEDVRELPDAPAPMTFTVDGETRELVSIRPNWSTIPTVEDNWIYTLSSYADGPITPMAGETIGRRTVKANFSFFDGAQRDAFLALLKRLRGRQVSCWVSSWTRDFELTGQTGARNTLRVEQNAFITENVLDNKWIGICVHYTDGSMAAARVVSDVKQGSNVTLTLDRDLPVAATYANVAKVSVLYRVRQASDSAEVTWHTKGVSECSMSFITVKA